MGGRDERRTLPITVETMRDASRGGTVLGTTRGSPLDWPDGVDRVRSTISEMGLTDSSSLAEMVAHRWRNPVSKYGIPVWSAENHRQ